MPITDRLTMANQLPSLLPGLERDSAFTKPNFPLTFIGTSAGEESSLLRWKVNKISHYRPPTTAAPNGRSRVGGTRWGVGKEKNFPFQELGALAVRSRAPALGRNAPAGCTAQLESTGHRRGQATASSPLGSASCAVSGSKLPAAEREDRPSTLHPGGGVKVSFRPRDDTKHQVQGAHHTKVGFTDFRSITRPWNRLNGGALCWRDTCRDAVPPFPVPCGRRRLSSPREALGTLRPAGLRGVVPLRPQSRESQRRVLIPSARPQPL